MENWGIFFLAQGFMNNMQGTDARGQQLPFYVSVCLRGIRLSAFFIRPPPSQP